MEILPLEKPLYELSSRIEELRESHWKPVAGGKKKIDPGIEREIQNLEEKFQHLAEQIYANLSPYQITQLSRHPQRPYTLDILGQLCTEFIELHGDRNFMDDASIVGGIAKFRGIRCVVIGHQKGRNTKENIKRNFGMSRPEGYRKALRLMSLAERLKLPIVTFVDTPGAYPGMDAEERGQSEAIAKNIMVMCRLKVPIVCTIVGEGGSGGALAIAVGNRVLMCEYSTYSVISPEGCASILWKDGSQADRAAAALGVTADKAYALGLVDEVIPEPLGGAHWKARVAIDTIGNAIERHLRELMPMSGLELREHRMKKFADMGQVKRCSAISPFRVDSAPLAAWDEPWEDVVNASL